MQTWKKSPVSLAPVLPTLCSLFSGPPLLCLQAHSLEELWRLGGMPAHFGLPFFWKFRKSSAYNLWRGTQKTPELSSGGWASCSTGFLHYVSVLGTHLHQCTSWRCCERLRSDSEKLSLKTLNAFAHFIMGGLQDPLPHHTECWAVFDPKWHAPHALSPLFTLPPPKGLFVVVVLLDEKVLKRKCFADVEEVKQKMAKALKGIQINEFKNQFEQ